MIYFMDECALHKVKVYHDLLNMAKCMIVYVT